MIKVLVVDDSAFMRKVISDIVESDPTMKVVGTARDGSEALRLISELSPDVVTMDIEMPVMDGLTALQRIMSDNPLPVIMLSSLTTQGAESTMKALDYGAFDFIPKPNSIMEVASSDTRIQLVDKIQAAGKTKIKKKISIDKQRKPSRTVVKTIVKAATAPEGSKKFRKLIAIGTSTGGPKALQEIIPKFPKNLDAGIVIVQHMPPGFTKSLADRLDTLSQIHVKEAEDGEVILSGCAYIAPGDKHLRVMKRAGNFVIQLNEDERVSGHRPSVDAMFYSIASLNDQNVVGVILTGMGSDGAKGMQLIKNNQAYTIAQDEESCVVYGMPKSAVQKGAVDKVSKLNSVANDIIKALEV